MNTAAIQLESTHDAASRRLDVQIRWPHHGSNGSARCVNAAVRRTDEARALVTLTLEQPGGEAAAGALDDFAAAVTIDAARGLLHIDSAGLSATIRVAAGQTRGSTAECTLLFVRCGAMETTDVAPGSPDAPSLVRCVLDDRLTAELLSARRDHAAANPLSA